MNVSLSWTSQVSPPSWSNYDTVQISNISPYVLPNNSTRDSHYCKRVTLYTGTGSGQCIAAKPYRVLDLTQNFIGRSTQQALKLCQHFNGFSGNHFHCQPLFNYNYNMSLVITGIEWGRAGCQDIYKHTLTVARWKVYKASKNHYLYKLSGGQFYHMCDKP